MPETEHLVRYSFFFFYFILSLKSQTFPDSLIHLRTVEGIDLIINQNYDEAENLFEELDKLHPEFPVGKIYLAASKIASAVDYAKDFETEIIEQNLGEAEDICQTRLAQTPDDIWYNYLAGLSNGYFAYYQSLKGDLFPALTAGLSSIKFFEKCLEIDSSFYEAKVAIGIYKYWKSVKTKPVDWLPFFEDESERGIEMITSSLEFLTYNFYISAYSLIWIYIEQGELTKAEKIVRHVQSEYPKSRFFMWANASVQSRIDPLKSADQIEKIYQSLAAEKKLTIYNDVNIRYKLASELYKGGKVKKALKLCRQILSIEYEELDSNIPIDERIEKVKALKNKLESKR